MIIFASENGIQIAKNIIILTISKLSTTSNTYKARRNPLIKILTACLLVSSAVMASCSTGIESTKKITMNKEDLKLMAKTEEQNLASSIKGTPLSEWKKGKPFIAMSDRTLYIFEPSSLSYSGQQADLTGRTLYFSGLESHVTPDLSEECVIVFTDGDRQYRYLTGKSTEAANKEIDSSKLPLMSDPALIELWREKIVGSTLWTKSNLWYDEKGQRISGLKFAKVKVEDVTPATGDFPVKVKVRYNDNQTAYLHMNYTSDMPDSRNFSAIFFLSDPKKRYPQISEEHWSQIQRGKVMPGMTKEECRLSLGNPDELNSGHNASQTMDIWQYSNGAYLMFTDGLLTRFKL